MKKKKNDLLTSDVELKNSESNWASLDSWSEKKKLCK